MPSMKFLELFLLRTINVISSFIEVPSVNDSSFAIIFCPISRELNSALFLTISIILSFVKSSLLRFVASVIPSVKQTITSFMETSKFTVGKETSRPSMPIIPYCSF